MMDWVRRKIESRMVSDEDRRKEWEENLRKEHASAQKTAVYLSLPTKPWGFWKDSKMSAKHETNANPVLAKMPGRSRPNVLE